MIGKGSWFNRIGRALTGSVDETDVSLDERRRNLQPDRPNHPFLCIIDGANGADDTVRVGPFRDTTTYPNNRVKDLINVATSGGTDTLQKTAAETVAATADGWVYYEIDVSAGAGSITASDATLKFSTSMPSSGSNKINNILAYVEWDSANSRIKALQQIQYDSISLRACCAAETCLTCPTSCNSCAHPTSVSVSGFTTCTTLNGTYSTRFYSDKASCLWDYRKSSPTVNARIECKSTGSGDIWSIEVGSGTTSATFSLCNDDNCPAVGTYALVSLGSGCSGDTGATATLT